MLGGASSRCFVAGGFLTLDDGKSSEKLTSTQAGLPI